MKARELWNLFSREKLPETITYTAWAFGGAPDKLADLVVKGMKTATASAYDLYQLENEPLPKAGDYSVVLDSLGEAKCIIQTTKVYVVPFFEVGETHAYKEGEGDRTLTYWRKVHKDFFTDCLKEVNLTFTEMTKVVCEEFHVVYLASA